MKVTIIYKNGKSEYYENVEMETEGGECILTTNIATKSKEIKIDLKKVEQILQNYEGR